MKRSLLKRKTPLKRSGQLKRTAIKRSRPKTSPEREKYRRKFKKCQCCDKPRNHVHEICTRGQSNKAIQHRCCFLSVCAKCHWRIHNTDEWPIERQLSRKQRLDPEGYCLAKFNELRGRGPSAITQEEVDEWNESDRVRLVPIRPDVRSVGREQDGAGSWNSVASVNRKAVREMAGRAKATDANAMSPADDLRATIRALEIKADVQRGHLQRTENELAKCRRQLSTLSKKESA